MGSATPGDEVVIVGRCREPEGRWILTWFVTDLGEIRQGWLNLDLADPLSSPLFGSDEKNLEVRTAAPVRLTSLCP